MYIGLVESKVTKRKVFIKKYEVECRGSKWRKVPFNPANCVAGSPGNKMKTFAENVSKSEFKELPTNDLVAETKIKK